MRAHTRRSIFGTLCLFKIGLGGLLIASLSPSLSADPPKAKGRRVSHVSKAQPPQTKNQGPATSKSTTVDQEEVTTDVLKGIKSGQLSVTAEGTGDGRMTLTLTNRTNSKLRVVLPPGLMVSGATGQFGGG